MIARADYFVTEARWCTRLRRMSHRSTLELPPLGQSDSLQRRTPTNSEGTALCSYVCRRRWATDTKRRRAIISC